MKDKDIKRKAKILADFFGWSESETEESLKDYYD